MNGTLDGLQLDNTCDVVEKSLVVDAVKEQLQLIKKAIEFAAQSTQPPTEEEINDKAESFAFQVPYDGSNKFYGENKAESFVEGAKWAIERMKSK